MNTLKFKINILLGLLMMVMFLASPLTVLADDCSCTAQLVLVKGKTVCTGNVDPVKAQKCVSSTPIWKDVEMIVNVMSAGVGVVVTGVIIVGGVQYTIAGGNPQALQAARQRITNGLIALFLFIFIYAFLQWLIPGGVFSK